MIHQVSDKVIVRTPLFSFDKLFDINVEELIKNDSFLEAVYLSSPSLIEEAEKSLSNRAVINDKVWLSLYRYYLRAAYRSTPFGLFAGISIGNISNSTSIKFIQCNTHKKNTRLDTHFLSSFAQLVVNDPAVRPFIKWYGNNTSYLIGHKLMYIEYRQDTIIGSHHLTSVRFSQYVQTVLMRSKEGATINDLVNELVDEEINVEEATSFVEEMISNFLLISELEPHVTGLEYHHQLIEKLNRIPSAILHLQKLLWLASKLKGLDKLGLGVASDFYEDILSEIKNWNINFDSGKVFQCDLYKPNSECQISSIVIDELNRAIILLSKITSPLGHENLENFKVEFTKRFESQEVSLLEVLDSEVGIGYPVNEQIQSDNAPLLANLLLKKDETKHTITYSNNKWTKFLLFKYHQAIKSGEDEIELIDFEMEKMLELNQVDLLSLPDSATTLCSILASSGSEVDKGNFLIYCSGTATVSAVSFFSRFTFASDELRNLACTILANEENTNPNQVFGEILHIAEARDGNILLRPALRKYEIPILTRTSVNEEHTIPLQDLMVSIKNGRIFLRSKKLNKEVIPRLTTAHNFSLNPVPIYHFLCDLQFQGLKANLSWDWGFLNEFAYLPRVRYGKTILAKARWKISVSDFSTNKNVKESELEGLIKPYFASKKIPNRVTISQGDNQLPIHIENEYCLKILAKDLKKFETLELHECLFNESNLLVRGPEGGYTNEIIIPWTRQVETVRKDAYQVQFKNVIDVQRSFLSGDKWHYIKIYCGVKTADKILTEVLKPITEEFLAERKIVKWFFIRYADSDHHIRVRFLGEGNFHAEVTNRMNVALAPYLKNNLIWKVQTDTYNRELERYGILNIDNSETLFFYDSIATLQVLSLLEGDEGDDLRWQFAFKGVNDLLDSFGYNLSAKKELMNVLSANFKKEFNAESTDSKKQLGVKFRELRPKIELALQTELDSSHEFYEVWQLFEIRKKGLIACAMRMDELYSTHKLEVQKSDLLASYIHMFLNRFFRSKQRMQEMVVYDLLHQHYKTKLARTTKSTSLVSE